MKDWEQANSWSKGGSRNRSYCLMGTMGTQNSVLQNEEFDELVEQEEYNQHDWKLFKKVEMGMR